MIKRLIHVGKIASPSPVHMTELLKHIDRCNQSQLCRAQAEPVEICVRERCKKKKVEKKPNKC